MTPNEARELFAYDAWAMARVFSAAEALTADELQAPSASSFPSVRATLGHIVGAQWVWLRRWLGESPAAQPPWAQAASLSDLKAQLATVDTEREAFFSGLTDAAIEQPVAYRNFRGDAFNDRLSGLIRHVINHSSYHRGQLATQLRQLGKVPQATDLVMYLHELQKR